MSRVAGKTGRTRIRVYRSLEDLPEELPPGKYIVEGAELELHESTSKRIVKKMLQLLRRYGEEGWV